MWPVRRWPILLRSLESIRAWPLVAAFLGYSAIAIVATYPLITSLGAAVPNDLGDPLLNVWLLWWHAHKLPFSAAWWDAPFFHPVAGSLTFSEQLVGLSPITTPVQWLGFGPVVAYNVAFLLSFPLCALSAHGLAAYLTRRHDAGLVSGLAFGFAPYRVAHVSHLDILSSYWMPLALLGLHGYVRTRKRRWLFLFGGAWLLQALCKLYWLFFLSVLVVLWLFWFAPRLEAWRARVPLVCAWALAAACLLPVLVEYKTIHALYGLSRASAEIEDFSASPTSLFTGSPLLANWVSFIVEGQESWLYPGATVVVIAVAGLAWGLKTQRVEARARRGVRLALAAITALFALVALSIGVVGPWRLAFGGVAFSAAAIHKPLAIAFVGLLALFLSAPRLAIAHRRRSTLAFYLLATGVMWLFSLGPSPRIFGLRVWDRAPYWWLMRLPGFESLRVPARFAMLAALSLSVAAGLVVAVLVARASRFRLAFAALTACGILWDGWIGVLPLARLPEGFALPGERPAGARVLELPLGGPSDAQALYRSIGHGLPLINGFSGHEPPHYKPLRLGLERSEGPVLTGLATGAALFVAVHRPSDPEGVSARFVSEHAGARSVSDAGEFSLWLLPPIAPPHALPERAPVAIAGVRSRPDTEPVAHLIDGELRSYWSTSEPQRGGEKLVVDLGVAQPISAVVLSLGDHVSDFPRFLRVDVSNDGLRWEPVWRGSTSALAVAGCLEDPRRAPLTVEVGTRRARFVRLLQRGGDPVHPWSAAELTVLGPPLRPGASR